MSIGSSSTSAGAPASPLPPSYSPPDAAPPYASEPSEDERRLDYVARASSRTARGVFTLKTRRVSVTLTNQENGVDVPVYTRHSAVSGEINIQEADVCSVSVKVSDHNMTSRMFGLFGTIA